MYSIIRSKLLVFFSLLLFTFSLFVITPASSNQSALEKECYFFPLRVGTTRIERIKVWNREKYSSKMFIRFIAKNFPLGEEDKWIAKVLWEGLWYQDSYQTSVVRSGEFIPIDFAIWTAEDAQLLKLSQIVVEIYPLINPKQKTTLTMYAICLPPKEIKLHLGESKVTINELPHTLEAPLFIYKNRTFVPLRFIGESFGAKIDWDGKTQKISFTLSVLTLDFWIGKQEVKTHISNHFSSTTFLELPPMLHSNRTFVPLRAVSEMLGAEVIYDAKIKLITIYFPPKPKT